MDVSGCLDCHQRRPYQKIGSPVRVGCCLDCHRNIGSRAPPGTTPCYFCQRMGAPRAPKSVAKKLASTSLGRLVRGSCAVLVKRTVDGLIGCQMNDKLGSGCLNRLLPSTAQLILFNRVQWQPIPFPATNCLLSKTNCFLSKKY